MKSKRNRNASSKSTPIESNEEGENGNKRMKLSEALSAVAEENDKSDSSGYHS